MDTRNEIPTDDRKAQVGKAASDLLNESTKLANELYEEGVHKACEVQDNLQEYSDKLLAKVKEKPLTSILIAGGVGFLLSSLLKK